MKSSSTKVFFRYGKDNSKIEAIATKLDTKEEIARREVLLRHGDKPNREIGRKYAFKKLMQYALDNKLIPGKEVEELWKSFSSTCRQPKEKLAY